MQFTKHLQNIKITVQQKQLLTTITFFHDFFYSTFLTLETSFMQSKAYDVTVPVKKVQFRENRDERCVHSPTAIFLTLCINVLRTSHERKSGACKHMLMKYEHILVFFLRHRNHRGYKTLAIGYI